MTGVLLVNHGVGDKCNDYNPLELSKIIYKLPGVSTKSQGMDKPG